MRDIAAFEFGARIIQASSYHSKFLPNNILDRDASRPWISTGLYPQYFIISFPDLMQIHSIDLKSYNVHNLQVERCTTDVPLKFEQIAEKSMNKTEDKLQVENISNQETSAKHLKFTIKSGFDSFCAVYGVTVMGSTQSGRSPMPVRKAEVARLIGVTEQEIPQGVQLDVVDNDLYPRHISQGPAVYDPEETSTEQKRFHSAFKVPDVKKVMQSQPIKKDSAKGFNHGRLDDDQDGDVDDEDDVEFYPKPSRLSERWKN